VVFRDLRSTYVRDESDARVDVRKLMLSGLL